MRHGAWTEEAAERAALYALGALTQTEACAFEGHLEEGCEVCRDEADQYQVTVESLATATLGVEPPVAVLDRVLKDIRGPKTPDAVPGAAGASQQFVFVRADNEGWQETMKGIFVKPLHVDEATGLATSLVRMAAGTNLPAHQHVGVEQFLVLEGDCQVRGEHLGPGDYHRAMTGSVHESTYTEHGTTLLLIAPIEYRFIEA